MKKILFIFSIYILSPFSVKAQDCINMSDFLGEIEMYNEAISVDLVEGWNMIGYPCPQEMNAVDAFSSIAEGLVIVKNASGSAYLPEWGFDGLGDLEPGQGYQLKTTAPFYNFQFCESNINYPTWTGCTDCEADNFSFTAIIDDGTCTYSNTENSGCTDPAALNYDPSVLIDNGNCIYEEIANSQTISVSAGWNMISTYLTLDDNSIESMFAGNESDFETVNDLNGAFYWPAFGFNGIVNVTDGAAYQLYATNDFTLELEGEAYVNIGDLDAGTNWVAHTKPYSVPVEDVYAELEGLVYVSDVYGNTYQPALGINDLGLLKPGHGYYVIMSAPYSNFSYPEVSAYTCVDCTGCTEQMALNYDAFATVNDGSCAYPTMVNETHTSSNMELVFMENVFINAGLPSQGWLVAYYEDDNGVLKAGSAVEWNGEAVSLSLWADNSVTDEKDGFSTLETPIIEYQTAIGNFNLTNFTSPPEYGLMTIFFNYNNYFVVESCEGE